MKRIINGRAYNTATALHVATAVYGYERANEELICVDNIYRTSKGAFFRVEEEYRDETKPVDELRYADAISIRFSPLTYDEAHELVMGKGAWSGESVELLAEDIFPSVEEAEEAAG